MRCFKSAIFIQAGSRNGSPVIAEACQTTSQKRKLQPDDDEEDDDDEVEGESCTSNCALNPRAL
jgi:hypothetical protein